MKVRALSEDAHARAVRGRGRGAGSGAVWAAAIRWSAASSGGDSRDDARALARRAREAEGAPFPSPAANAADDGKKRPERAVDPNERLAFLLAAVDAECVSWEEARAEMAAAHPGWADPALALASTRADRLARRPGDVDAAEATWASFTENEYRDVGEAHAAHAEFLWRVAGKVAEARAVPKRAHCRETLVSAAETSSSDPPGTTREKSRRAKEARPGWAPACEAWIRPERAVGTLEHQLEADAKAGARLRALEADLAERRRGARARPGGGAAASPRRRSQLQKEGQKPKKSDGQKPSGGRRGASPDDGVGAVRGEEEAPGGGGRGGGGGRRPRREKGARRRRRGGFGRRRRREREREPGGFGRAAGEAPRGPHRAARQVQGALPRARREHGVRQEPSVLVRGGGPARVFRRARQGERRVGVGDAGARRPRPNHGEIARVRVRRLRRGGGASRRHHARRRGVPGPAADRLEVGAAGRGGRRKPRRRSRRRLGTRRGRGARPRRPADRAGGGGSASGSAAPG